MNIKIVCLLFVFSFFAIAGCGTFGYIGVYGEKPDDVAISEINISVSASDEHYLHELSENLNILEYTKSTLESFAPNTGRFSVLLDDAPYTLHFHIESIAIESHDAMTISGLISQLAAAVNQNDQEGGSGKDIGLMVRGYIEMRDNLNGATVLHREDVFSGKVLGSSHRLSGLTMNGQELSRNWVETVTDDDIIEALQTTCHWSIERFVKNFYDKNF